MSTGETDEKRALAKAYYWEEYGRGKKKDSVDNILNRDILFESLRESSLDEDDARRIIEILQSRGLIETSPSVHSGTENENLIEFLTNFWNYETSRFVKDKLKYGHPISRKHCEDQTLRLRYWREYFPDHKVGDVTTDLLGTFQDFLLEKDLAAKTVNMIVYAGLTAFRWAKKKKMIGRGPGLDQCSAEPEKKGILTPSEVKRLFSIPWKDERARVGNLLSCTTGARAGKVLAIRKEDIGENVLHIPQQGNLKFHPLCVDETWNQF